MTISSTIRTAGPYTGTGSQQVFSFAFKVFVNTDLLVILVTGGVAAVQTLTSQYTVSLNADQNATPGGTITMLTAPVAGSQLTLTSQVPELQPTNLANVGNFYPQAVTDALDRATIQIQQIEVKFQGALRAPTGELINTLPPASGRANSVLGFDAFGNPVATLPASGSGTALALDLLNGSNLSKGVSLVAGAVRVVDSIAALKLLPKSSNSRAFVAGYLTPGDGGGGHYWYDPTDTTSVDNAGTTIVANDAGRWKLVYLGNLSVLMFGADRLGVRDSYAAFQAAANVGMQNALGLTVNVPDGNYIITSNGIKMDRSANAALGRVSFVGGGEYSTRITYTGADGACFYIANAQTGSGEPNTSYQTISNMTLIGPSKRAGSVGVQSNLAAFLELENLYISGFDYGKFLEDTDQAYFRKLTLRFNNQGSFVRKTVSPGAASTQPNNLTYVSCTISNNTNYGGLTTGGSSIVFIGGDYEYNGTNPATDFGLKFTDLGYEGSTGVCFIGGYFEGNVGLADVYLEASTVNATPILDCVHTFTNTNFKRLDNTRVVTNHIATAFGNPATVGHQSVVTTGCGFKSYAAYTPSAGRPSIGYLVTPATTDNYTDCGSYFGVAVEKPAFIQNLNKRELVVSRTTNQTFTTGVTAAWAINTALAPNPLWSPTPAGSIIIPETGTYSVSVYGALSTTTAGSKYLTIKKNGAVIGYGESTTTINAISASVISRFAINDVLTFEYTQATGANQDIAGSSGSLSNVTIAKVF